MTQSAPEPSAPQPSGANDSPQPPPARDDAPQPSAEDDAQRAAADRRAKRVLVLIVGAYALALLMLVALDQVAVVWKSLVVPGIALAAALTGRLRAFVRDWAVFLSAVVLFDASRGFVYALVMRFELPVYMAYAIKAEKAIFGEPLLTLQVQHWLTPDGHASIFDKVLALIYGSHFVLFLLYGLAIWMTRERDFGRFKLSMLLVMYLGVLGYLLVPTVPPWMASGNYFVIPPILEIGAQLFHANLPTITTAFELNPIAAMPSLHCAFPTLLTLITFRHFRHWGWLMVGYTFLVSLSTIQLGHHYGVDVLGGIALALLTYALVYGWDGLARVLGALAPPSQERAALRARLLVTGLLLSLTAAEGVYGLLLIGPDPVPSETFIAHELDGKSPMASYYHGLRAMRAKDYTLAQQWFAQAVPEVPAAQARNSALGNLAVSAYFNRDYRTVVWAARRLPKGFPAEFGLMIADSMVRSGEQQEGFELLDRIAAAQPNNPNVKLIKERLASFRQGS